MVDVIIRAINNILYPEYGDITLGFINCPSDIMFGQVLGSYFCAIHPAGVKPSVWQCFPIQKSRKRCRSLRVIRGLNSFLHAAHLNIYV